MKMSVLCSALLLATVGAGVALAAGHAADFKIHNSTGIVIESLYVSEANDNEWGKDILGVDVLADGDSADIDFSGDPDACNFDIKLTNGDDSWIVEDIDLCAVTKMKFTKKGSKVFFTKE